MLRIIPQLNTDQLQDLFVFTPGQRLHFTVQFEYDNVPDQYQIKVIDQQQNARLVSYGKGSNEVVIDWLIPENLLEKHLGIWELQVTIGSHTERMFFLVQRVKEKPFANQKEDAITFSSP
ncbi:MAG: hypothetical protein EAX86_04150 [Candidatus Heimdallarchaeota archaeon]|nr:hypothetical protein [Candidatus Heimdallarchaeota archaeon]